MDSPSEKTAIADLCETHQIAQHKYARFLNGTNLLDKIPTEDIFKELQIPSVNQVNAQIKLLDVWKSQHSKTYPTKWASRNDIINDRRTRASNENALIETYGCRTLNSTFKNDAARLWNRAPALIKESVSLYSAKMHIKKFILTLPL